MSTPSVSRPQPTPKAPTAKQKGKPFALSDVRITPRPGESLARLIEVTR